MRESYLDRKERLKGEGKIELPLNIDSKRYLFANISFQDLAVISPFGILSIILMVIFYKTGNLSQTTVILSLVPTFFMTMLQIIKHPIRKNIPFLKYQIIWKIKYNKRQKQFIYQKGEIEMEEDVRKRLGIKNVVAGCYETTDDRFVKVIQVSTVNLSLMNPSEKTKVLESYRTFLNELPTKYIQQAVIAQPINLSQYLLYVDRQTESNKDYVKSMLVAGYKSYIEQIQKSRNMVQREHYIIISKSIGSDREKTLNELEKIAMIIQAQIENMLSGSDKLQAKILQNDELIRLIYTCLDYDNAQSIGENIVGRAQNELDITLGEESAKEVLRKFEQKLYESIN